MCGGGGGAKYTRETSAIGSRLPGGGGGGTASLRVGSSVLPQPSPMHCPCWFPAPCFQGIKGQPIDITVVTAACPPPPPSGHHFQLSWYNYSYNCSQTIIIANPGCFPWTSQANNYRPNRTSPSDSPPPPLLRVLGSVTAPSFLAYSQSSGSLFCSGYPKPGWVTPPPPLGSRLRTSLPNTVVPLNMATPLMRRLF